MGFQVRKRTKGKSGWLNFSKSGVSQSIKMGFTTLNIGPRGVRSTINFGHGIRHVSSKGWGSSRKGKPGFLVNLANTLLIISGFIWIVYFIMIFKNS